MVMQSYFTDTGWSMLMQAPVWALLAKELLQGDDLVMKKVFECLSGIANLNGLAAV